MEPIGKHLPIVKSVKDFKKDLNPEEVDEVVRDLIRKGYGVKTYKKWYYSLVYEFGIQAIKDLQARCRDANEPPKLFAYLAKKMQDARKNQRKLEK